MKIWPILIIAIFFITPLATAWDQMYPFAGTYTICHVGESCYSDVIPVANTTIFVNLQAGGGGGKGTTQSVTGRWMWGYGGSKGGSTNITASVPLGSNYDLIIGGGGAISPPLAGTGATISYDGGDTTAFGTTVYGGAKGATGTETAANGTAGENATFLPSISLTAYDAVYGSGENALPYYGGSHGYGYGSGGGGGASNMTSGYAGTATRGGDGMNGMIHLWDMNGTGGANIPSFTATPTNVGYGSVVSFTDGSIINDGASLAYDWDFGDGTNHSTTIGSVTHVYSTYGVFTPNLTITSDTGTQYYNRSNYITVTNLPITAWMPAKTVKIKIVDAYGTDLPLSNVSAQYLTNSLPSKDPTYLVSAYGVPQSVANQMVTGSVAMYGMTGTNGELSFLMYPSVQYGITITNTTMGLSKYVEIYPTDTEYVIRCPLTSQAMPTMASTSLANASLYVTEPNASWITWNLLYSDPSGHTTGLTWNVTCWNNGTVMHNNTWGAVGSSTTIVDNYTFPSTPTGMEYVAVYDAVRDIP